MKHQALHHPAIALPDSPRPGVERLFRYLVDRYLLLPIGALIALVWANTLPESYFRFSQTLAFGVNEIAMAFFLALVVQEVLEALMPGGALHSWRRWALALMAAAGGVAGSAAVYLGWVAWKHEAMLASSWPIACAVDVAAAYYVLKIVWQRSSALPFVLLLALATDAFGVIIVALRPQPSLVPPGGGAILMLAALGIAAAMRYARVRSFWAYMGICGPLSWFGLYLEGVHPALALVPIVLFLPREPRKLDLFADTKDDDEVHHFEHEWNELVQVILFLFGLVNAGVLLRGYSTGTWAILVAALVGRPLGILAAAGVGTLLGFHLPGRVGWRGLIVIALATSSGFTFALFFATGLIPIGPMLAEIKLGALLSAAAALLALGAARIFRIGRFAH